MNKVEVIIYDYLLDNLKINKWVNQKTIIQYLESKEVFIAERYLRTCIQNIRKNPEIKKIILTDFHKGYKILTEVEHRQYLENRKISLLKSLKQYWKDVNNFNMNNQIEYCIDDEDIKVFQCFSN